MDITISEQILTRQNSSTGKKIEINTGHMFLWSQKKKVYFDHYLVYIVTENILDGSYLSQCKIRRKAWRQCRHRAGGSWYCRLTVLGRCAGQQATPSDLLPPQANLLFELLNLTVAVSLLLTLLLLPPQIVLHQLNGSNKRLGNAEMSVLLQNKEKMKKLSNDDHAIVSVTKDSNQHCNLWRFDTLC